MRVIFAKQSFYFYGKINELKIFLAHHNTAKSSLSDWLKNQLH